MMTTLKQKTSLQAQATAIAIALGTIPVLITGGIAHFFASQSMVAQIHHNQVLRTELASDQVNTFLLGRLREVQLLATNPLLQRTELTPEETATRQQTIQDFVETLGHFNRVVVFDSQGNLLLQEGTELPHTSSYQFRPYLHTALVTKKPLMNGPRLFESSSKLLIEFAIPIMDPTTSEAVGVIMARVPGESISHLFDSFEDNGNSWYLVNNQNTLFAGSNTHYLTHAAEQHFPNVDTLIDNENSNIGIITKPSTARNRQQNTRELVSYTPVQLNEELSAREMGLLVTNNTQLAFAPQRRLATIFAIGSALTALLTGAIATILAKRAITPIQKLTLTAQEIVQAGDFTLRAPIKSQDELGVLAASLNQLIEWIGSKTQDLETSQLGLEQRTQELSAIINNLGDGLLVTNATGHITRFNPPLKRLFGQTAETQAQHIQGDLVSEHFQDDIVQLVNKSKDCPTTTFGAEVALANNKIGQALVSTIIDADSQEYSGSVLLIRDITTEKEVDRMKTDFISTVSHELRTPLTSVLGFAKIIQKKFNTVLIPNIVSEEKKTKRTIRQVKDNLGIIISEGERLTSLINDVLDIAKIEAGKIEWRLEPSHLGEIVEQAIAATSVLAQNNNVTLKADIAPQLCSITVDQDRLVQVIINLLSNAIKFTEGGDVICEVKQTEDEMRINVIDNGVGISEADQAKVFERFKQVGEIMTDKPKGTGLGLPICKQIVEHHNGRIWVESEIGIGSTFCVALPLDEGENRPHDYKRDQTVEELVKNLKAEVKQSTETGTGEKKTILVVDDENNIRRLLRQELETEGYRVIEAADGMAAIAIIKKEKPDLIITDVMMPRLDGFDLAAVLKTNPVTANIPTIILSIVEDHERGFRLGVDRYLSKPIDVSALLQNVENLITDKTSRSKVLVVNKNASTSKVLTEVLLSHGYVVAEARTSKEGLDKARSIKPDMVIVDKALCEENNIVKTLRFENGLENISVILVESSQSEEDSSSPA